MTMTVFTLTVESPYKGIFETEFVNKRQALSYFRKISKLGFEFVSLEGNDV